MAHRRAIAFILFDRALALNLTGPAEAFGIGNHVRAPMHDGYDLIFLSEVGGLVPTSSGVSIDTQPLASVDPSSLDTVIVVGGMESWTFARDAPLVRWIAEAAKCVRRTCSICTGAFVLAAAGLLDGRRVVTHWCEVARLKSEYANVRVELDPIYLHDGPIWTSAGMTAGIDLALALIEDDHDRRTSLSVAKQLIVFLHRPGGQAQFSRVLAAQTSLGMKAPPARLADLPTWIMNNLDRDLSVEALAQVVGMSPRTFARNFARWHAGTPAGLVQELRIEAACRYLEDGDADIKRIAGLCGFGDQERMRRAFMRCLAVPPSVYRERFGRRGAAATG